MSNPKEIYNRDFTNQSAITINGLDGNKHKGYVIKIDGQAALTSDPYLTSSLSNSWNGQFGGFKSQNQPRSDEGVSSGRPLIGANILGGGIVHYIDAEINLKTRSGKKRWCNTEFHHREDVFIGGSSIVCMHETDTTTNITSVTLNFPGGFTGNIIVEKIAQKIV